ncbi:MAG: outer membrane beta-barrel protein [Bacteroidota bacterium]|nr:outer membrane beta-barrel protein [Bacteroidota bacterium]
MRKFILLGILIPSSVVVSAQKWHLDLFGGFSNYQGDLQEKRFTTEQAKAAVSVGMRYDVSSRFSLRSNFSYATISAADRYNRQADLKARNLSFSSKITELNLLLQYNLLNPDFHSIVPYAFGGIAVFHFNPYAFDSAGNKVYLQPLGTEGQGLAGYNRSPYHLTQFAIPFGGGVSWRLTERVTLSYEIGIRKTFTDYLDDVSTTYVDQASLLAARGAKAVEMAYRGAELKNGTPYPADGTIRGGPKRKDWYYFSGVTVSVGLGRLRGFHGTDNGRTDCPKPVN